MNVPASLRESMRTPLFWARYMFVHEEGSGADRLGDLAAALDDDPDAERDESDTAIEVTFDVGDGYAVVLSVDTSLDSHDLGIVTPDATGVAELGWDDLAHWHPYALRWSELDLICRAAAIVDPGLAHPGVTLALLCRFAAVFDDDDVDAAVCAVDGAYTSLRPPGWNGYWPQASDWLERADFRGQNVVWQRDEAGNLWACQDDERTEPFYSTRIGRPAGTDGFPHERLRALLAAAAATAATGP